MIPQCLTPEPLYHYHSYTEQTSLLEKKRDIQHFQYNLKGSMISEAPQGPQVKKVGGAGAVAEVRP